jgi:hypothetical protein
MLLRKFWMEFEMVIRLVGHILTCFLLLSSAQAFCLDRDDLSKPEIVVSQGAIIPFRFDFLLEIGTSCYPETRLLDAQFHSTFLR